MIRDWLGISRLRLGGTPKVVWDPRGCHSSLPTHVRPPTPRHPAHCDNPHERSRRVRARASDRTARRTNARPAHGRTAHMSANAPIERFPLTNVRTFEKVQLSHRSSTNPK